MLFEMYPEDSFIFKCPCLDVTASKTSVPHQYNEGQWDFICAAQIIKHKLHKKTSDKVKAFNDLFVFSSVKKEMHINKALDENMS